ncbi:MAG: PAS domain S-box protein, partial [Planctomycetales bacterium]|nr:PAS domain S-box protein [Planctomycetales bacterium]
RNVLAGTLPMATHLRQEVVDDRSTWSKMVVVRGDRPDAAAILTHFDVTDELTSIEELQVALREAEWLRQALDDYAQLTITDRKGKILEVNESLCELSGFAADELVGKNHRILNAGDNPRGLWMEIWKTLSEGRVWSGEICNRRKDGEFYWVEATFVPYVDPHGRVEKYAALRFDITDLRRSKLELERVTRRLECATKGARVGIWDYCPRTRTMRWDATCHELHESQGAAGDNMLPYLLGLLGEEDAIHVPAKLDTLADRGEGFEATFCLTLPRSGIRYMRVSGTPEHDENGEFWVTGTVRDVTEQHLAEERLDLAMRNARIGLWDWHVKTGETYFSDTFYTMLGYAPGELPMKVDTWSDLVRPGPQGRSSFRPRGYHRPHRRSHRFVPQRASRAEERRGVDLDPGRGPGDRTQSRRRRAARDWRAH